MQEQEIGAHAKPVQQYGYRAHAKRQCDGPLIEVHPVYTRKRDRPDLKQAIHLVVQRRWQLRQKVLPQQPCLRKCGHQRHDVQARRPVRVSSPEVPEQKKPQPLVKIRVQKRPVLARSPSAWQTHLPEKCRLQFQ